MEGKMKSATPVYSLVHILYWITNCAMFNFAATYLLDKGYTNGQVGLLLALSYGGSALMQPAMAALFQKRGIRVNRGMAAVYLLACVLALLMLLLPLNGILLAVLFVSALTLHSSLQPALNSLAKDLERSGRQVNFGMARGIGSAAFSVSSAVIGMLLGRFATGIVPAFYLCSMALLAVLLPVFRVPAPIRIENRMNQQTDRHFFRSHPRFVVFLVGVACISVTHMFIDNFMIQIMRGLGGDSHHQGIAIAIAGVVELPAMTLYSRFSRRFGGNNVLVAVGWIWMVKDMMVVFATSPTLVYISELLQFGAFAMYVPAMVEYVSVTLPEQDFLKGQALAGSAFMIGCLLASSLGGSLIDLVGVKMTVALVQVFGIVGAILFTIAIPHGKRLKREN